MSTGARITDAGLKDTDLTIDGTSIHLPAMFDIDPGLRQSVEQTFNGRRRVDVPYDGVGLPDQPDLYDFHLRWVLDKHFATEIAFLERLRTKGGAHLFAYWKAIEYQWTATSGQTVFYLPRPDAFGRSYSGKTGGDYKAVVKINGVAMAASDVTYPGTVTAATSVASGDVAISTTSTTHEESGATVALFKFGDALDAGDLVTVEYNPLFNVCVMEVVTDPFVGEQPFVENKTLRLAEVN